MPVAFPHRGLKVHHPILAGRLQHLRFLGRWVRKPRDFQPGKKCGRIENSIKRHRVDSQHDISWYIMIYIEWWFTPTIFATQIGFVGTTNNLFRLQLMVFFAIHTIFSFIPSEPCNPVQYHPNTNTPTEPSFTMGWNHKKMAIQWEWLIELGDGISLLQPCWTGSDPYVRTTPNAAVSSLGWNLPILRARPSVQSRNKTLSFPMPMKQRLLKIEKQILMSNESNASIPMKLPVKCRENHHDIHYFSDLLNLRWPPRPLRLWRSVRPPPNSPGPGGSLLRRSRSVSELWMGRSNRFFECVVYDLFRIASYDLRWFKMI